MSAAAPADGARLIYLMGASGSGKDTLLRLMRARLRGAEPVLVAHRYITRDSGEAEDAMRLTPEEFSHRAALGCFALHWASHGLQYGIGQGTAQHTAKRPAAAAPDGQGTGRDTSHHGDHR